MAIVSLGHCADVDTVVDVTSSRHWAHWLFVCLTIASDDFLQPGHLLFNVIFQDLVVVPGQVLLHVGHGSVRDFDGVFVADLVQLVCWRETVFDDLEEHLTNIRLNIQ